MTYSCQAAFLNQIQTKGAPSFRSLYEKVGDDKAQATMRRSVLSGDVLRRKRPGGLMRFPENTSSPQSTFRPYRSPTPLAAK